MYNNWSALDVALCLELALQKAGDVLENVTYTLRSLSEKTFRQEDEDLPQSLSFIIKMEDMVDVTRRVVDNFYTALMLALSGEEYVAEAIEEDEPRQCLCEGCQAVGGCLQA